MKKTQIIPLLLFLFALFAIEKTHAQEPVSSNTNKAPATPQAEDDDRDDRPIFVLVTIPAEYIDGKKKFNELFIQKFKRPKGIAKNVAIDIKMSFIVEKDGSLSDIKVIKSPGFGTEEEAIYVLKQLSTWKPTQKNNQKVQDKQEITITIPPKK
ncbi:MAG: energy transducer TonB [Flavobacteriaceae bacterium]|jgi:protein TonB|nr:energy transducer TonB [Flavobacteriaceae bacterium]